jgi:NAD(P)-dependent dehydrogenase (short-subunit alcohol dehydrogenase family)
MTEVALIVGVGPRLGAALARRFAQSGMSVALASRVLAHVESLAAALGSSARAYACDATDESQIEALYRAVEAELGTPTLVVYNVVAFSRKGLLETTAAEFESGWRAGCFGGFLLARAAARSMIARGLNGTIIFTGNTSSVRGGAEFHSMTAAKFALRGLAQSIARELQPRGVHIAHVVIDGLIADEARRPGRGPDAFIEPDAIAETYLQIHRQPKNAWTTEMDLRTWVERSGEIADILSGR